MANPYEWYRNAGNPAGNKLQAKPTTIQSPYTPSAAQGWPQVQQNVSVGRNYASPVVTPGVEKPMERTYNAPAADPVVSYPSYVPPVNNGQWNTSPKYGSWMDGNAAKLDAQPPAAGSQPGLPNGNTLGVIGQYFNPYYQQIMDAAVRGVEGTAAARGHARDGTWAASQIGDAAYRIGSQAWNDAAGLYNSDRTYAAGRSDVAYNQFDRDRRFNYDYYADENKNRYNQYQDRATAYNKLMSNRQSMMSDLAGGGPKAASVMADMAMALGMSQADLALAFGKLQSDFAQANGGNDSSFWSTIVPLIFQGISMAV